MQTNLDLLGGFGDPRAITMKLKRLARSGVDLSEVLLSMQLAAVQGNVYHYNTAISACQGPLWQSALQLLGRMSTRLVPADAVSYNSAIAAVGLWRQCIILFRHSEEDGIAFNSMVSACSKVGRWELAEDALIRMRSAMVQLDHISFTACLDAYGIGGRWERSLSLLKQMSLRRVFADTVAWNCAMRGEVRWEAASESLASMQHSVVPPDRISYDIAIGQCGSWHYALRTMLRLKTDGCPSITSYHAAISACEAQWRTALDLVDTLSCARPLPDIVSYNTSAGACQKALQWLEALEILRSLPRTGFQRDSFTYGATLGACRDSWQLAIAFVEFMGQRAVLQNAIILNALTSSCGQGGCWQLAIQTLSLATESDGFTYAGAISACEKAREWQRALWLFWSMPALSLKADVVCFAAAISACEKGQQWQHALCLFSLMHGPRVEANRTALNALISALEKCSRWQPALSLLDLALPDADVVTFNAATWHPTNTW